MLDMMRPGRVEIPSCSLDSCIKTVELGKAVILQNLLYDSSSPKGHDFINIAFI